MRQTEAPPQAARGVPFAVEYALVNVEHGSRNAARWLIKNAIPHIGKSRWLATRGLDYSRFQSMSTALGALPVSSAAYSLTRLGNQKRWASQKARRSGLPGLIASIRSAA